MASQKPIFDTNGNRVEEGDVIKCVSKRIKSTQIDKLFVKHHSNFDMLVVCTSEETDFHSTTLSAIASEYNITVIDEHQKLFI